ncbi:SDR family NAD(P)-dependent oxidoreductase [Microbacterium azadirachtae]|uniref:SDR family NAD(P)-dependent oxidoreductase n=1 Tax=Microbacterium azadirachtae TaxID=582680 RepID=UPI000B83BC92
MTINAASITQLYQAPSPSLNREAQEGGRETTFIIVASQAGISAEPDNAAYSASKFALIGWARSMRTAALRQGIRIHVASPGCTERPSSCPPRKRSPPPRGLRPKRSCNDASRESPLADSPAPSKQPPLSST